MRSTLNFSCWLCFPLVLLFLLSGAYSDDILCRGRFTREQEGEFRRPLIRRNSSGTTIAREIRSSVTSKESVDNILAHFEEIRKRRMDKEYVDEELTCDEEIGGVVQDRSLFFGFGNLKGCLKFFDSEDRATVAGLIEAITNLNIEMENFGPSVARDYGLKGWDFIKVYANDIFPYITKADNVRDCSAYRAYGYRVNGTWALGVILYKHDYNYNAGAWKKELFTEFVTGKKDGYNSLNIVGPVCDKNKERVFANNETGTAVLEFWDGVTNWAHHHNRGGFENNHFGLQDALDRSAVDKELMQDSRAPSNIAILMLPAVLTLFPLSMFQEVGVLTVVLYSIATDIISVLPILIKGFEMLIAGSKIYYSVTTSIDGPTEKKDLGLVQTFPAFCRMKPHIRIMGIVFVCIGFAAMVVGVSLEYFSFRRAKRRNENFNEVSDDVDSPNHGLYWYLTRSKSS